MYRFIEDLDPEVLRRPMEDAERVRGRFRDLREALPPDRVRAAVDGERWRSAVETGVIERLYDVSPGVTEAIVRHGLDADEARGLEQSVFDQISAHRHAEDVVVGAIEAGKSLSGSVVKELHAAVTAGQPVYVGTDQLGRQVRLPLHHGAYKQLDNHVRLKDGSLHEYPPAIHVDAEMDRLVALLARQRDAHPVTRAAFAHHRLTQIHPFEDGNGRTARLVASLELVRAELLPLVVPRRDRNRYLAVLRAADEGALSPLVELLVEQQQAVLQRLETVALEAPGDDLSAFADALAEYTLRRRRDGGVEDLQALLAETGKAIDDVLQRALGEALAPFQARGLEVRYSSAGRSLLADDEDDGDVGRRAEGLARLPGARALMVPAVFAIGEAQLRRLGLFVVPLQSLGGNRLAVIADMPAHPPLVLEGGDDLAAPRVRRWIEDVVGRALADYVRQLY